MDNKIGKAYAFFHCNANYDQIQTEFPSIRKIARTPSNLELSLHEGVDKLFGENTQLDEIVKEAKDSGMRYAMRATLKDSTNKSVANEVADILNQAYQSQLYQKDEEFIGAVVYEENGQYIFRD